MHANDKDIPLEHREDPQSRLGMLQVFKMYITAHLRLEYGGFDPIDLIYSVISIAHALSNNPSPKWLKHELEFIHAGLA
jgi:hypothetical protein